MSSFIISIKADRSQDSMKDRFVASPEKRKEQAIILSQYFKNLASGQDRASFRVQTGAANPVSASIAITVDQSDATADDTISFGSKTLTAKASGASADEFNIGSSDAQLATNLTNAINTFVPGLRATVAGAVVTVTCLTPGSVGNLITVAVNVDSGTPFDFSGSALAGGTGGALEAGEQYSLGVS